MISTTHHAESSASLYVAFELSTKEWWLTMSSGPSGKARRRRIGVGDQAALAEALATGKQMFQLAADAPVRSCYEAGRDGFWPHHLLTAQGVDNLVVDSSSIEVPRRAKHAKTDRLDGDKLLRLLLRHWSGERGMWQVVQVPTPEQPEPIVECVGVGAVEGESLFAAKGGHRIRTSGAAGGEVRG